MRGSIAGVDLRPRELACWQQHVATLGDPASVADAVVTAGPAGDLRIIDELLALYLSGRKTAGSSVLQDFLTAGDPPPQVGDHWICLDGRGEPGCLLRTESIVVSAFDDVDEAVAVAEGEGDLSLATWRQRHAEQWVNRTGSDGVSGYWISTRGWSVHFVA